MIPSRVPRSMYRVLYAAFHVLRSALWVNILSAQSSPFLAPIGTVLWINSTEASHATDTENLCSSSAFRSPPQNYANSLSSIIPLLSKRLCKINAIKLTRRKFFGTLYLYENPEWRSPILFVYRMTITVILLRKKFLMYSVALGF